MLCVCLCVCVYVTVCDCVCVVALGGYYAVRRIAHYRAPDSGSGSVCGALGLSWEGLCTLGPVAHQCICTSVIL